MPKQPFLPKYSKSQLTYGPGHIKNRPKIAEAIGRCIMTWSYIDWQMAMLLAALMKAKSEASVAIFLTLRNARAQREVLIAAAEMTLTGSDKEMFDAIMFLYGSLQSNRADLAHGIFGDISASSDDVMAWIETKHLSKDWMERFHGPDRPDTSHLYEDRLAQKHASYVYTLSDLERLENDIMELWGIAFAFTSKLNWPDSPIAETKLQRLCSVPQMVRALSQIRDRQSNQPPAVWLLSTCCSAAAQASHAQCSSKCSLFCTNSQPPLERHQMFCKYEFTSALSNVGIHTLARQHA